MSRKLARILVRALALVTLITAPSVAMAQACVNGARTVAIPDFNWVNKSRTGSATYPGFGTVKIAITGEMSDSGETPLGLTVQNRIHNTIDTQTVTITFPRTVASAQFRIRDIDNDERIVFDGYRNGIQISPTLTAHPNAVSTLIVSNRVARNAGDAVNGTNQGTVIVDFNQSIDKITFVLDKTADHVQGTAAEQFVILTDLELCNAYTVLSITKDSTSQDDFINPRANSKRIPGSIVRYVINVSNDGQEDVDADTVLVRDRVPSQMSMCFDVDGEAVFAKVFSPDNSWGLTYTFIGKNNLTDDLEFSNDLGASWSYLPVLDADRCDAAITNFRVRPSGIFRAGGSFRIIAAFRVD